MAPVKVTIDSHYKGDFWSGMVVGPVLINGAQPAAALHATEGVRMQFRDEDNNLGQEFSTVSGTGVGVITVTDYATWEFTVLSQLLNLYAGIWYWGLETKDVNGVIITLYKGTITVIDDITDPVGVNP
jgi:hypothetical protein